MLIATPTTRAALLRAIHYGWRRELIAESGREIADIGRELRRRLAIFAEPLAKVGRQLGSAVVAYNEAVGSCDRRVVPQLRRIEQAGASSERPLPARAAVEEVPRSLSVSVGGENAPELPMGVDETSDAFDEVARRGPGPFPRCTTVAPSSTVHERREADREMAAPAPRPPRAPRPARGWLLLLRAPAALPTGSPQ